MDPLIDTDADPLSDTDPLLDIDTDDVPVTDTLAVPDTVPLIVGASSAPVTVIVTT